MPPITSRGSITLPRDLLIFLPWASLTMACRYTCRAGEGRGGREGGRERMNVNSVPKMAALPLRRAPVPLFFVQRRPSSPPRRRGYRGLSPEGSLDRMPSGLLSGKRERGREGGRKCTHSQTTTLSVYVNFPHISTHLIWPSKYGERQQA